MIPSTRLALSINHNAWELCNILLCLELGISIINFIEQAARFLVLTHAAIYYSEPGIRLLEGNSVLIKVEEGRCSQKNEHTFGEIRLTTHIKERVKELKSGVWVVVRALNLPP
jgi:hypothetical protein